MKITKILSDCFLQIGENCMKVYSLVMDYYLEQETTKEQVEMIADILLQITKVSGREILMTIFEFVTPSHDLDTFELVAPCLNIGMSSVIILLVFC